jgi:hypothetical protein
MPMRDLPFIARTAGTVTFLRGLLFIHSSVEREERFGTMNEEG